MIFSKNETLTLSIFIIIDPKRHAYYNKQKVFFNSIHLPPPPPPFPPAAKQFFPYNFYKRTNRSTQNFHTFSSNSFATLVPNFKVIPISSCKSLNLNQDYPSKNCFFQLNSYKIEFMIFSLIEMLE